MFSCLSPSSDEDDQDHSPLSAKDLSLVRKSCARCSARGRRGTQQNQKTVIWITSKAAYTVGMNQSTQHGKRQTSSHALDSGDTTGQ